MGLPGNIQELHVHGFEGENRDGSSATIGDNNHFENCNQINANGIQNRDRETLAKSTFRDRFINLMCFISSHTESGWYVSRMITESKQRLRRIPHYVMQHNLGKELGSI